MKKKRKKKTQKLLGIERKIPDNNEKGRENMVLSRN